MIKKYSLNHYIKLLCISDSVSQLALCQYQVEFSLRKHIFLEDLILVQVVHKLRLMFWKFLLEIWMDVSPLFCFVLELCHNIIIENQNFMAFWLFWSLTGRNPIFLLSLFFKHHLCLKHDLVAAIRNLFHNIIAYHYQYPKYINSSGLMFKFQPKQKTQRQHLNIFQLHHWSLPITSIIRQRTKYLNAQMDWKKLSSIQENLGGYGAQIFLYQFLEPHTTSDSSKLAQLPTSDM